jgi:SAM-dependent methyltransferase
MEEEEILEALREHVAAIRTDVARHENGNNDGRATGPTQPAPHISSSATGQITVQPDSRPLQISTSGEISLTPRTPGVFSIDRVKLEQASEQVRNLQNTVGQLNPRNPGILNAGVQAVKKMIGRSLSWYTRSLHALHASIAQALDIHTDSISSLQKQILSTRGELSLVQGQIGTSQDQMESVRADLLSARTEIESAKNEIMQFAQDLPSTIDARVKSFTEQVNKRLNEALDIAALAKRDQQSPYVPLFHGLSPVLDIGCGRGEFLELLKEAGVTAYGIDSDPIACDAARSKALNVVEGDLFQHLRSLPDRSLAGVFSARVIEYLPLHLLTELISLCCDKLKPGGIIVLETITPDSDSPFGRTYRIDPSHFRAVYPEVLKAMLEAKGFPETRISVLAPKDASSMAPKEGDSPSDSTSGQGMLPITFPGRVLPSRAYAAIARRR